MSLQYCAAISLFDSQVLPNQFEERRFSDPDVIDLAHRVEFFLDAEIDALYPEKFASKVEVVLKDGQSLWRRVDYPKGSVQNPMSAQDIEEKFKALAARVKNEEEIKIFLHHYRCLEELPDLNPLISSLR